MSKIGKTILILLIILFLSLYFSKYNTEYYGNKQILTEEAIAQYEKDLKEGKEITARDYLVEEKNYTNKASQIGIRASRLIEKTFSKGLQYVMRYLESLQNG